MSRGRSPSQNTRLIVWGRAAGRCQYTNCGERLDQDLVSGELSKNFADLAHNIASSPNGARGHSNQSHELADDPDNILLLCGKHHREIDDRQKTGTYCVEAVRAMKRASERRIDKLLSNPAAPATHILRMSATVGDNETAIPLKECIDAVVPTFTLTDGQAIDIKLRGMEHKDSDSDYYPIEIVNLRRRFEREIRGRFEAGEMQHLAVFAFAPIPILMELGRLVSDLSEATVYGRHREPSPSWTWPNDAPPLTFSKSRGHAGPSRVALKLSITAEVGDNRVSPVFGGDEVSIWEIRSDRLGSSALRNGADLGRFRRLVGEILDEIRLQHGSEIDLSIFPAIPIPCAVEFGRVWQPKVHLAFNVYDETPGHGFVLRHRIEPGKAAP